MRDMRDDLIDIYKDFFGPASDDSDDSNDRRRRDPLADYRKNRSGGSSSPLYDRNSLGKDDYFGSEFGVDPISSRKPSGGGTPSSGRTPSDPGQEIETEVLTQTEFEVQSKAQAAEEEASKEPEKSGMEELNELIGLKTVKHDVEELIGLAKVKKMREEKGMKTVPVSLHLVFSGNPGTGKTTVARILAKLYKEIGILSTGQLVETDRSGLVAGYVGQTAIKTQQKIQEAMTNGEGESIRSSQTLGMDTYYYALRLENGTVLRVSTQAHAIAGVFFRSLPIVAVVALLIFGICIVLGHALSRQIIQPIEKMAEEINKPTSEPPYKELEPFAAKIRTQHENLLEAVKTRQDFTANVSHELKTPLTAISGYAELIENGLADPESEKHIAQQIRANSDRLLQLINDTIQLSRLDHGGTDRNIDEIDLYEAASECCRNLKVSAEKNNILLTCDGRSALIRGDEEQIKELIENLVQNGIRYNNAGGYVRVSVRHEDGHAVLSVRDNGIGIAKEKQSRVFERFYRVDKSRSRDSGGTGLGLALVKHIAEIHNADIEMESTPGVGTVISVHFPEISSVSIQSVS